MVDFEALEMLEESSEDLNHIDPNLFSPLKSSEESNLKQQLHVFSVFFVFFFFLDVLICGALICNINY